MAKRPYRRRQFLVDPKLQLGLNLMVMVLLASYFALFCVATVCLPYLLADSDDVPDYWVEAFATAMELGMNRARGKYLVTLHTDTFILKDGWLDLLLPQRTH